MIVLDKSLTCPQAFAIQAVALWTTSTGKPDKDLAGALGVEPDTLSHWKGGRVRPGMDTSARMLYQLHLDEGFGSDATKALDLAWLMGFTPENIGEYLKDAIQEKTSLASFLKWLQDATRGEKAHEASHYLPSLPTYHVPTDLCHRVEVALIAPYQYRVARHQVVVLHGGTGAGKTTTAAAILRNEHLHQFFRDGILFIPLTTEEDHKQALRRACQQAGLEIDPEAGQDELARAFHQWIGKSYCLALLVLDDPPQADCLIPLLNTGPQVRVLITCQNRHAIALALQEYWEPSSERILWQSVSGLAEDEGLALVKKWTPQELAADEEEARQRVGEMIRWHPLLLSLCAAEARDTNWRHVKALLLEGSLDPDDLQTLAVWVKKSWDRLSNDDQHALITLQRASRHTSTFGVGFASAVWNQSSTLAQTRLNHVAARAFTEPVTEEPWPWQEAITRAYGSQGRYRLIPPLAVLTPQADDKAGAPPKSAQDEIAELRPIVHRAKELPIGPQQIPLRFQLANVVALPAAWLFRHDVKQLEERILDLWTRQGLHPPAEIWLAFQKGRWSHLSFGYAVGIVLLLMGGAYLRNAFQDREITWVVMTFVVWLLAVPAVYLSIRQRAWWLWLLGLHGQETTELRWTWRVARLFGLRQPSDQMALLSWKRIPPSSP
ncbi:MAG: AAA family ATPase [Anaerolineae bacterium]|nr:AAA family ATPase [Anaerolineae bacterium]